MGVITSCDVRKFAR